MKQPHFFGFTLFIELLSFTYAYITIRSCGGRSPSVPVTLIHSTTSSGCLIEINIFSYTSLDCLLRFTAKLVHESTPKHDRLLHGQSKTPPNKYPTQNVCEVTFGRVLQIYLYVAYLIFMQKNKSELSANQSYFSVWPSNN